MRIKAHRLIWMIANYAFINDEDKITVDRFIKNTKEMDFEIDGDDVKLTERR